MIPFYLVPNPEREKERGSLTGEQGDLGINTDLGSEQEQGDLSLGIF